MDDELEYREWLAAEREGRDDAADASFAAVFAAAPRPKAPGLPFTVQTMNAVAAAVERDARRARTVRRVVLPAGAAAGLVLAYLCSGLLVSGVSWVVVRAVDLLIAAVVYVATNLSSGGDVWTVGRNLGRATAALLTNASVTTVILALQGMALAALMGLHRLLRSERELFR